MSDIHTKRAKILGGLIRKARKHARRSIEECAQVLHISAAQFQKVEKGEHLLSLPDIEALALYLKVPMGYFWGSEKLNDKPDADYQGFLAIRQRVIGVLLRQLRMQARQSTAELAEALDVEVELIEAYESGATPIPYLHLEQLSKHLEVPVTHFVDDERGPLARLEMEYRLLKQFNELPPDMQAFLANPSNISYLETAKRMSEMDVEKLRQVAEGILDITF